VGNVVLKMMLKIGANTCVDRAALGINPHRKGTKLDNLIQIGHNVVLEKAPLLFPRREFQALPKLASCGDGRTGGAWQDI